MKATILASCLLVTMLLVAPLTSVAVFRANRSIKINSEVRRTYGPDKVMMLNLDLSADGNTVVANFGHLDGNDSHSVPYLDIVQESQGGRAWTRRQVKNKTLLARPAPFKCGAISSMSADGKRFVTACNSNTRDGEELLVFQQQEQHGKQYQLMQRIKAESNRPDGYQIVDFASNFRLSPDGNVLTVVHRLRRSGQRAAYIARFYRQSQSTGRFEPVGREYSLPNAVEKITDTIVSSRDGSLVVIMTAFATSLNPEMVLFESSSRGCPPVVVDKMLTPNITALVKSIELESPVVMITAKGDRLLVGGGIPEEHRAEYHLLQRNAHGAFVPEHVFDASSAGASVHMSANGLTVAIASRRDVIDPCTIQVYRKSESGWQPYGDAMTFPSTEICRSNFHGIRLSANGKTLVAASVFTDPIYVFEDK